MNYKFSSQQIEDMQSQIRKGREQIQTLLGLLDDLYLTRIKLNDSVQPPYPKYALMVHDLKDTQIELLNRFQLMFNQCEEKYL